MTLTQSSHLPSDFDKMLRLWQLHGNPHKTDGPDGLWLHLAAVCADLPFLKAMGRYNADWNVLEKGTGRCALILIVLRARTLGQPFVVYPEDLQSPQQRHFQQRSLISTLRWCGCHPLYHAHFRMLTEYPGCFNAAPIPT
jgi:hypothetical protein